MSHSYWPRKRYSIILLEILSHTVVSKTSLLSGHHKLWSNWKSLVKVRKKPNHLLTTALKSNSQPQQHHAGTPRVLNKLFLQLIATAISFHITGIKILGSPLQLHTELLKSRYFIFPEQTWLSVLQLPVCTHPAC